MSPAPRSRVIIDNDFGGDPDGLFQLAHHVLCTSVEIVQVISTRVPDHMVAPDRDIVAEGVEAADEVLALAGSRLRCQAGSREAIGATAASVSAVTRAIVAEAMRDDVDTPLFYAAGAGLTELAAALLFEPRIAERLTLVWIGGNGYDAPADGLEFNASADLRAAQLVFASEIEIWQVPESAYCQCLVSWAELDRDIASAGPLGTYLVSRWRDFTGHVEQLFGASLGECAVLGDSPLVLLTALRGTFRAEPSSSPSRLEPRRRIEADGSYGEPIVGPPRVRVFTGIDMRLMYGDLVAKLATHARGTASG
ncbi:Inosine-uridine preferring nucleoside hydrolase [Microbacterium hydrocarbonoxydans]|uniref:Inosine-uridine preferring nucleoside hydrolase n=1 Tax=Microbacterium hydrocarbonoxydans TaxID=273678 RepID=A0A0M2HKM6_9MICO|nr:nucleoside hydrolase [Microbacterium hydrocarbonoxydans]KJL47292.1 Inosine-uridine preferring nucleoside hydrolase [Microbacterium hydrocarbonoxydans]